MARFQGVPVEAGAAATAPRFQGKPVAVPESAAPTAQSRYDAAIQAIVDANPGASPEDIKSLKEHYGPSNLMDLAQAGTTFGLSDELSGLAGGLKALFAGKDFGSSYSRWAELEAAREGLGAERNGMLGSAAEIVPSLLTGGPERELLQQGIQQAARVAPSALKMVATGLGMGGTMGAVGGFTNTDGDLGERVQGAEKGGLIGAAIGTAAPAIIRSAGDAYEALTNLFSRNAAARTAGIEPAAADILASNAPDMLSPQARALMASAGPERMLADTGRSAQNTLDYAIQSSGGAGRLAQGEIDARVGRDSQAINDALDNAFGQPQGVETTRAGIRTGSAPARQQAYDAAYASPIDYASQDGQDLERILTRVRPADIAAANQMMREEGVQSQQMIARIADDGSVTFERAPDVRQIDYITRALNDRADTTDAAGKLGGQTTAGRITRGLATDIRDQLRLAVPEYDTALATAADPIRRSQAVQRGAELMRPSTTREEVADHLRNATQPEREAMAQGIRSNYDDILANVRRTVADGDVGARQAIQTLKDFSSPAAREKVAMVIGQQRADDLFAELDRASQTFEIRASVADNSRTFQRQNLDRQTNTYVEPNALQRGKPLQAGQDLWQRFAGASPARTQAQKDRILTDVARALLARGANADAMAQTVENLARNHHVSARVRNALIAGARTAIPVASTTAGLLAPPRQGSAQ